MFSSQEALIYIQNIAAKYGPFTYAEPKTPLNVTMLDRHLFDMIPIAWKRDGNVVLPPPVPIPKPIPARRTSVPARKIKTYDFIPPISGSGRIITQRVSLHDNVDRAKANGPDEKSVVNYRQSETLKACRKPIPKVIIKLKGMVLISFQNKSPNTHFPFLE